MYLVLSGVRNVSLDSSLHCPPPFLRVAACGICHSDRKAYHCPPSGMQFPRVLGHEVCGTLLVDLPGQQLAKGKRVVLWPAMVCGRCHYCTSGRQNLCRQIQLFGYHLDGGFAHELTVPASSLPLLHLLEIPDQLTFLQAIFAEPVGCVINGLRKVAAVPRTVLIFGAGFMGRVCSRLVRIFWPGSDVCLYDVNAQRYGAAVADGGCKTVKRADLVFVAASSSQAFAEGVKMLNPGGTMILFSGFARHDNHVCLDHNDLHRQEQTLTGAYGCLPVDMQQALKMIADGELFIDDLFTSEVPLTKAAAELARTVTVDDYKTIINLEP